MARLGLTNIKCAFCGKNIPFKPMAHIRRTKNTYCSQQCTGKAKRIHIPVEDKTCEICGIPLTKRQNLDARRWNFRRFCAKCNRGRTGQYASNWKGGRTVRAGYSYLNIDGKRIQEHRIIAEKALGRPLKSGEVVHHVDCNKSNNANSNLLICDNNYHRWLHWEMSKRYAALMFGAKNGTSTGVV